MAWSPETGYRADDPRRGPAATVSVRFESDTKDIEVQAQCSATGTVTLTSEIAPDDHGGNGGGHGEDDPSPHA
jgi:hypothetical protein